MCTAGGQDINICVLVQAEESREHLTGVLHELYYRWHSSLWSGTLGRSPALLGSTPSGLALPTAQQQLWQRHAGSARLQATTRGLLAASLVVGPASATPVAMWPARLLQLKLAVRHLGRYCTRIFSTHEQ